MFKPHIGSSMAAVILRLGLAVIFLSSGGLKIAIGSTHWTSTPNLSPFVQGAVAWGEMACGVACLLGLLSRIAAAGIIAIMVGAIVLVTGKQFTNIQFDRGSNKEDTSTVGFKSVSPGYEYNIAIMAMAGALGLLGSGPFSIDELLRRRRKGAAVPPGVSEQVVSAAPLVAESPASPKPASSAPV